MRKLTPAQLRKELYRVLDEILESGEGVEVERPGGKVLLVPQFENKLDRLKKRTVVVGDSSNIDEISWEHTWNPDSF